MANKRRTYEMTVDGKTYFGTVDELKDVLGVPEEMMAFYARYQAPEGVVIRWKNKRAISQREAKNRDERLCNAVKQVVLYGNTSAISDYCFHYDIVMPPQGIVQVACWKLALVLKNIDQDTKELAKDRLREWAKRGRK